MQCRQTLSAVTVGSCRRGNRPTFLTADNEGRHDDPTTAVKGIERKREYLFAVTRLCLSLRIMRNIVFYSLFSVGCSRQRTANVGCQKREPTLVGRQCRLVCPRISAFTANPVRHHASWSKVIWHTCALHSNDT